MNLNKNGLCFEAPDNTSSGMSPPRIWWVFHSLCDTGLSIFLVGMRAPSVLDSGVCTAHKSIIVPYVKLGIENIRLKVRSLSSHTNARNLLVHFCATYSLSTTAQIIYDAPFDQQKI